MGGDGDGDQLGKIDHIIHLMLENRSVDHMLGFLYADSGSRSPTGHAFDGLTGEEWNPDDLGRQVKVYKIQVSDAHPYLSPGADPGEGFRTPVTSSIRTMIRSGRHA